MSEKRDDEQLAAVQSTERAIAVLAGPGSGKTRVLSLRARHLLKKDPRSKALLLTFTNKAAAEMKSRTIKASAVASNRITACTYHSFTQGILRAHGKLVGLPQEFEVLDPEEQEQLANTVTKALRGRNLRWEWSRVRLRCGKPSAAVHEFGERYQALKQEEGAVDFDDLLVLSAKLFEENPQIAAAYGKRYAHFLLDEFQDTNAVQFAIVRALAQHSQTVSVFADDDQAIFRFAGADSKHIVSFTNELRAKEYPLTVNYRCRNAIVECANSLIRADSMTSGRQMRADKDGGEVRCHVFDSAEDEAVYVADQIALLMKQGVAAEDISILVRSEYRAVSLIRTLIAKRVPVSNWLDRTHESKERRLLRCCLAVIADTLNTRSASRLCELFRIPHTEERATEAFLSAHAHFPGITELQETRKLARGGASVELIVKQVQAAIDQIDTELAHSFNSLLEGIQAFKEHDPDFSLENLLSELALGTPGGAPTEGGGVKLASLHRTKGLQWPNVFLVGLEEGTLPDHRSVKDDEELRQERRLCFVGVCRAEDQLVVTRVKNLAGHWKEPSVFLEEMGFEIQ